MNDQQVKDLIKNTFEKIESAKTIREIEEILTNPQIYKSRMDENTYPKLQFKIDKSKIRDLIGMKLLNQNNSISNDVSGTPMDTLTKLLYAVSWKQGDLKKLKHIVDGITSVDSAKRKTGLVFYHFGRHLTQGSNEPIIDQHVLRAFGIRQAIRESNRIDSIRRQSSITDKHEGLIKDYKVWLSELKPELKMNGDYMHHVDKVLFATGKTVKSKKP